VKNMQNLPHIDDKLIKDLNEIADMAAITEEDVDLKTDIFNLSSQLQASCLSNSALLDFVVNTLPAADTVSLDSDQYDQTIKTISDRFNKLVNALINPMSAKINDELPNIDRQLDKIDEISKRIETMLKPGTSNLNNTSSSGSEKIVRM